MTYILAKLPILNHGVRFWYDGQDSVYLFGDTASKRHNQGAIVSYSISQDTVNQLGTLSNRAVSLQSDWDGNLSYFGAYNRNRNLIFQPQTRILKYDPLKKVVVERLPYNLLHNPTIKLNNDTVLITFYLLNFIEIQFKYSSYSIVNFYGFCYKKLNYLTKMIQNE